MKKFKLILVTMLTFFLMLISYNRAFAACGTAIYPPGPGGSGFTCTQGGMYPSNIVPAVDCNNGGQCCSSAIECSGSSSQGCANGTGINTAIGCIPLTNFGDFAGKFLKIGIGIGGGVAFLMIIYAGFIITTSTGDPGRLQAGKELLGAAIGGLLLIIFSVFVLRLLGVNILGVIQ